ncbi:alpha/beta fold hydrolase [Nonomuraea lactucae]|uniref:alpha/beta fold hydrolase n=1 Tax=Nonomuraea lactucae TaxID=2249762 RepID=UPI000DE46497|nr:alpha/beta hydrolase [Nonomuraea lactucae]
MDSLTPAVIPVNGIDLSTYVVGEGPVVVLAHGFPELAYSWRHQVPALAGAGYRVVVPDMRGFGRSSRPADVGAYHAGELAADLVGLLDALDEPEGVFVGHDWGASVVWHVAVAHPGRVRGVAGLSVPYAPPAPAPPTRILRKRLGDRFYMIWFQEEGPADEALAKDARGTMAGSFSPGPELLGSERPGSELPGWLSEAELKVYVDAFERTGFTGGLNYYRNLDRNWEIARELGVRVIESPALFVTGSEDPVRRFMPAKHLEDAFTDLRGNVVLDGAGHWIQQERADEVNALLLRFLESLDREPPAARS